MKRLTVFLLALAALFLATTLPPRSTVQGDNPGTINQPILAQCSDVNGADGAVGAADLALLVSVFGDTPADPTYRLLYDAAAVGAIGASDIAAVVADFGDNITNGSCALVDYQIAVATLAITSPTYSNMALCGGNCGGSAQFLTEDATFLATKGYYQGSFDVPGQGRHYINDANWDGVFNPARPEGLVYNGGKLVAQLYVVVGDVVGWGPVNPPLPDQNDIDAFCNPSPCSWASGYDGWHVHFDLCTTGIGTSGASALPGVSDANCPDEDDTGCPVAVPDCNRWDDQVGWMGHLWNHEPNPNPNSLDINSNGRFADCFPDGGIWKGFNCPQ